MPEKTGTRLQHAWNAFFNRDPTEEVNYWKQRYYETSSSRKPDRPVLTFGNERSIVASVYTRIAIDVSSVAIRHVRLDQNERYVETIFSGLNECFSLAANLDQSGRSFIRDAVISLFDEGVIALVPVETTFNPKVTGSYDVTSIRTGKILEWYPAHVRVLVYNETTGKKEELVVPKTIVAIIENPLYMVMNEPNSTLKRLIRKLNILDAIDEQSGSGKLDLIIQLPYVIKTPARREQADQRRADIEMQLAGSKYGVAYTDGTEKVTQLNRPAENNLMGQITYLTAMLYSQLGLTEAIMNGTAKAEEKLDYFNRTIEPIVSAIVDGAKRTFLTKTARSQLQSIMFFQDPFKLVPVGDLADIADKFTRNAILSSNEFRSIVGYKPSKDPEADKLRNKNLNASDNQGQPEKPSAKSAKKLEGETKDEI